MSAAAEILRSAAEVLRSRGWTQDYFARNVIGSECDTDSPEASCFCSLGAIAVAAGRWPCDQADAEALLAIAIVEGDEERLAKTHEFIISDWNDAPGRTVDEVLAMFARATAEASR